MPSDASNPNVRTSMGSASYAPESDSLIWKIKSFPGGKVVAQTTFALSSVDIDSLCIFSRIYKDSLLTAIIGIFVESRG